MLEHITDKMAEVINYVPFMSAIIKTKPTPISTRLIETAIMALVAGGLSIWVAVPVIQKDLETLRQDVRRVDLKVDNVGSKVEKLRSDLYEPRNGGRN